MTRLGARPRPTRRSRGGSDFRGAGRPQDGTAPAAAGPQALPLPRASVSLPHSTKASGAGRRPAGALLIVVLAFALVVGAAVAVTVGPSGISLIDVVRSVGSHLGLPGVAAPPRLTDAIVWQLRAPRVVTAAAVGAGLAISGAVMQSITRNALADPYLLGVSSGASVGAVAVLVVGISVALPVAAFAGALLALTATLAISAAGGTFSTNRLVLAGVAIAQLGSALTAFIIFWSVQGNSFQEILNWLLGSLAGSTWESAATSWIALAVAGTVLAVASPLLDAFAFGETSAAALGVNVNAARWLFLIAVAVLTGTMVAVSGAIGFVGLILPHIMRRLAGPGHRLLLPVSALAGALFLIAADTLARTAFAPRELPVGVVTALLGVPVFILIVRRGGGRP